MMFDGWLAPGLSWRLVCHTVSEVVCGRKNARSKVRLEGLL